MKNIDRSVFVAQGAKIIGNVAIGKESSVWFNATIRGDSSTITIGEKTNIQDNAVIHTSRGSKVVIGNNVTIGHGAIVHGCSIGNNVLIGMGAIILDGTIIEDNCIVGAGTLISQNKIIPSGSLVYGNPFKIVRQITSEEKEYIIWNANDYVKESREYQK